MDAYFYFQVMMYFAEKLTNKLYLYSEPFRNMSMVSKINVGKYSIISEKCKIQSIIL